MYTELPHKGKVIKLWIGEGEHRVPVEPGAEQQLRNIAELPIVAHLAGMPDLHLGIGATVGSVIATRGAIIPSAVGVDIGCGMVAVKTTLRAEHLPDSLLSTRLAMEAAVPVGQTAHVVTPREAMGEWVGLAFGYRSMIDTFPEIEHKDASLVMRQIGTLGGGNHFEELCLDGEGHVWIMLHSGSRNVGNRIGTFFIEKAKRKVEDLGVKLTDRNLAWLAEGDADFEQYRRWVQWAQSYARANREAMLKLVIGAMRRTLPAFSLTDAAINCHHNYVAHEEHHGELLWVTRKGAVNAEAGALGIIPGSMGTRSYIVRGKGNADALCSCSHGAGRTMSRGVAKKRITLDEHEHALDGIECRKDAATIDESPAAYKNIDDVMAAQTDLVEVVATLKQVLCVKG